MKYWFDKNSTKNNVIILSAKALIVASTNDASHEHVEQQLDANTHPKIVFGAKGFRVIPFSIIAGLNSPSSIDTGLEIAFKAKDKTGELNVSFDNTKSKLECMGYIRKLMLKHSSPNTTSETPENPATVAQETKQPEKNVGELPVSDIFTVKSTESAKPKSKLDVNYKAMFDPALGLILALAGTYLLYPKLNLIALVIGGLCVLASLYFLYLGFKKPTDDETYDASTNNATTKAQRGTEGGVLSKFTKLTEKVFNVFKPIYLLGIATLAIAALYFLIPTPLSGPSSLYQAIQTHQTNDLSIQSYMENGADINFMAEDGTTPLITALNLNAENLVIELINNGASLSTQYIGQTPLDLAIEASLDNAVDLMLKKEMVTSNPQDLLIRSIASGLDFNNIQHIADSGMDMDYRDEEGLTALGVALLFGSEPKVVKLLLDRGASIDIKVGEATPLEFAKLRGYKEITEMLEQHNS